MLDKRVTKHIRIAHMLCIKQNEFIDKTHTLHVVCMFQGVNVREKAKQLVTLLKDEERLREERIHALKTKEKMAQTSSGKN